MCWQKELAYTLTPKTRPMRRMETLLDAIRRPHWHQVGNLLCVPLNRTGPGMSWRRRRCCLRRRSSGLDDATGASENSVSAIRTS